MKMRVSRVQPTVMVFALAALCLFAFPATAQIPSSAPFCDGFEDGPGYQTRWTSVEGSQTLVSSPVHSGNGALAFEWGSTLMNSMYRTDFEACTGEYSAWCRQENIYGFALLPMVQPDTDEHPTWRPGYTVAVSALGSVNPGFWVGRHTGIGNQGDAVVFDSSLTPKFGLGEWVRVFMRIYSGGMIVAGYERGGVVDSVICFDPNPIQNPGRFYVGTSAPSPTPDFFDDVCYDPLPCSAGPICFDRGSDVNCDGIAGDVFDVIAAIEIAFSGGAVLPCASKP